MKWPCNNATKKNSAKLKLARTKKMYCSHSVVFFPLFFIISKQKRLAKKTSEEAAKVEQTLK